MLDFGFSELLLIIVVAVLVVGPKELPAIMVGLGRVVRRVSYIRFALSQQFEDFMKEADLSDIREQVNFEAKDFDEDAADADYTLDLEPRAKKVDGVDG